MPLILTKAALCVTHIYIKFLLKTFLKIKAIQILKEKSKERKATSKNRKKKKKRKKL